MRRIALAVAALFLLRADMYQDGSNAASVVTFPTLRVNDTLVYPNEPRSRIFGTGGTHGTTSGADINAAYKLNVDADDADCLSAAGCYNTYIGSLFGGSTLKGNRTGLGIYHSLTSPSGNLGSASSRWYTGLGVTVNAVTGDGGTPGSPNGNVFGANFITAIGSGASNINTLAGLEIDVTASTGSSVAYKTGLTIVQFDGNVRGSLEDMAIGIANGHGTASAGWLYGLSFGMRPGSWPMAPTGTLIGTNPSTVFPGIPYTAANGVDFRQVTFSDSAFASPGFSVSGTGSTRAAGLSVEDTRPLAAGIGGAIQLKGVNNVADQIAYGGIRASAVGGTAGAETGDLILQAMIAGALTDVGRFDTVGGFAAKRNLMVGSLSGLSLKGGEVGMQRNSEGNSAPGAAGGKLGFVCGTTAGTAKLVAYAGASATPVTVIDNIGAGVSGC